MSKHEATREATRPGIEMKPQALRVKTDIVKTYYVETKDGWIYGGPFDTKEEAQQCLSEARNATSHLNNVATNTAQP